jgi:hypothetical protein
MPVGVGATRGAGIAPRLGRGDESGARPATGPGSHFGGAGLGPGPVRVRSGSGLGPGLGLGAGLGPGPVRGSVQAGLRVAVR